MPRWSMRPSTFINLMGFLGIKAGVCCAAARPQAKTEPQKSSVNVQFLIVVMSHFPPKRRFNLKRRIARRCRFVRLLHWIDARPPGSIPRGRILEVKIIERHDA